MKKIYIVIVLALKQAHSGARILGLGCFRGLSQSPLAVGNKFRRLTPNGRHAAPASPKTNVFKKFSLVLALALIPYASLAQTSPALDFNKMDPTMAKSVTDLYCKNIEEENKAIDRLNKLAADNNRRLQKGSYAVFEVELKDLSHKDKTMSKKDTYQEKWKVAEIHRDKVIVTITEGSANKNRAQVIDLKKIFYGPKLNKNKPTTCLLWRSFAEEHKLGDTVIKGKKIETFYRRQALLGNVVPEFTYGVHIPFNLVHYVEKSMYGDRTVIKTKSLVDYSF